MFVSLLLAAWLPMTAPALPPVADASAVVDVDRDEPTEYAIKAVLLEKILPYITWPSSAFEDKKAPLVIGVFGKDVYGEVLDKAFAKSRYGKRKIEIRRFADGLKAKGLEDCHVLLVPPKEAEHLPELIKRLAKSPTFLVGDSPDFARIGGTFGFYTKDKKIAFEINIDRVKALKLKVSSELLKLARVVRDEKKRD